MKKYLFLVFSLFLFSFSNLYSANLDVSGITYPQEMNGIYTEKGTFNDRPYYEHEDGIGDVSSIFYYDGDWMIYPGRGPYNTMGMWSPDNGYFFINSTALVPPYNDYSTFNPESMPEVPPSSDSPLHLPSGIILVTGYPLVQNPSAVPVSLWGIVLIFFLIGGTLIFRYYKKRSQIV